MPENAFPRVLADSLIGDHDWGYRGLTLLTADLTQLKLKPQGQPLQKHTMAPGGFYRDAIEAWKSFADKIELKQDKIYNKQIFFNPSIKDETGETLKPIKWMVKKSILTIPVARAHSGVGMKRDQWFEFTRLRNKFPNIPYSNSPKFTLKIEPEKDAHNAAFKEIYLAFRSKIDNTRHYEQKWHNALGIDLTDQWTDIWKRIHESKCSLKSRSQVWRQINLNFWTSYMEYAYRKEGDGNCHLCAQWARNRWHTIIECEVVTKLWKRFGEIVHRLAGTATVDKPEMAFGITETDKATKLRNRLGFVLRATVMSMRATRIGSIDATVDRIWSIYLHRLKKELVEEWYCASLEGNINVFEAKTLVNGFLGKLDNGKIQWSPLLDEVGYHYFNLF